MKSSTLVEKVVRVDRYRAIRSSLFAADLSPLAIPPLLNDCKLCFEAVDVATCNIRRCYTHGNFFFVNWMRCSREFFMGKEDRELLVVRFRWI